MKKTIISVPTKTYDGGSNDTKSNMIHPSKEVFNAFSYYSSQERRMSLLLGLDQTIHSINDEILENHRCGPTSSYSRATTNNAPTYNRRRTRVSWEVHPSLILE
jgi:hypothetical protein